MQNEIFRPIPYYEALYQISNLGRVKRSYKNGKLKILNHDISNNDYHSVVLCKNNIKKKVLVHRLVAQVFIPNPDNKEQVDHIDLNKNNNQISNLRWATRSENCKNKKACNNTGKKFISERQNRKKKFRLRIQGIINKCFEYLNEAIVERNRLVQLYNIDLRYEHDYHDY